MAELIEGREKEGAIRLPGYREVLHIRPAPKPTKQDYQELRDALAEDRAPRLSEELLAQIEVRQERARQIRESSQPKWRQVMIRTITDLDNLQDLVATAAWVTGPVLERLGPVGKAAHATLAATAKGLNWMEKALVGPTLTASHKARRARARRANAKTRKGALGAIGKAATWVSRNQGHLIEAAQASDTLFGVGLSLGAIFGAMDEAKTRTAIKAYNWAQEQQYRLLSHAPGVGADAAAQYQARAQEYQRTRERVGPIFDESVINTNSVTFAQQLLVLPARLIMPSLLRILGHNPTYTTGDRALAMLMWSWIGPYLAYRYASFPDELERGLEHQLEYPQSPVLNPLSWYVLSREGIELDDAMRPIGAWYEAPQSAHDLALEVQRDWEAHHDMWLVAEPTTDADLYPHYMMEQSLPITAWLATGDPTGYTEEFNDDDGVIMAALDQGIVPPADATHEELVAWFAAARAARAEDPDAWRKDGLRQITERAFARNDSRMKAAHA